MGSHRLAVLALVISVGVCCAWAAHTVKVVGRGLYVNGDAYLVKAVGYAPTPIGVDPTVTDPYGDYFTTKYSSFWRRDIPIIKNLGANTIKLWGWNIAANHTDFLDACSEAGLFVIPTFYMSPAIYPSLYNNETRSKITADFGQFLKMIGNHDAILFYNLGSDLNADWMYASQAPALYEVLSMLATQLKETYDVARPSTTALNDNNGVNTIGAADKNTTLSLWSYNVYRGCGFGNLFADVEKATEKPFFISEFGIDAWNDKNNYLDETMQAECYTNLWGAIEQNEDVVVGGAVTEYADEFWKSKLAQTDAAHPNCPSYDPTAHTTCGYPNENFPDKYANEAWFGIVDPSYKPRLAYSQLQELWRVEM